MGLFSVIMVSPDLNSGTRISCGPRFNQYPASYIDLKTGDWPLINARNITKNGDWCLSQAEHDKGVEAEPGDIVEFWIYFHNGCVESEESDTHSAFGTMIQASSDPPLGAPSLAHRMSATIRSANTYTVTSSSPGKGGDIVVHIKNELPLSLTLVSGSVQEVHPKNGEDDKAPFHLIDTICDGGVDLGTVRSGMDAVGFILFRVQISGGTSMS